MSRRRLTNALTRFSFASGAAGGAGGGGVANPPELGEYADLDDLYVPTAGWDGGEPEQTTVIGLTKTPTDAGGVSYGFPDLVSGLGARTRTKEVI